MTKNMLDFLKNGVYLNITSAGVQRASEVLACTISPINNEKPSLHLERYDVDPWNLPSDQDQELHSSLHFIENDTTFIQKDDDSWLGKLRDNELRKEVLVYLTTLSEDLPEDEDLPILVGDPVSWFYFMDLVFPKFGSGYRFPTGIDIHPIDIQTIYRIFDITDSTDRIREEINQERENKGILLDTVREVNIINTVIDQVNIKLED